MKELSKKHKTYSLVRYVRGIELEVLCVTTSKKKFAEILDVSLSQVNGYGTSYDLRYPICNENPDVLFAKPGMGGEAMMIFDKNEVKTLEEYEHLIDEHRKLYSSYRDYQEKTGRK